MRVSPGMSFRTCRFCRASPFGVLSRAGRRAGITFALCYRARPYGGDPHKCIFESYAIERFPEGREPKTNWVYAEPTGEKWGSVLAQDFSNMAWVQKGMRSRAF